MTDKIEMFRIELNKDTLDQSQFTIKPELVYNIKETHFSIWQENLQCGLLKFYTPESHFIFKTKLEAQTQLVKIIKNRISVKLAEVEELTFELQKVERELENENV